MHQEYIYDSVIMLLVSRLQRSHRNDCQVMSYILYEVMYNSQPRDGQVYNADGFPTLFTMSHTSQIRTTCVMECHLCANSMGIYVTAAREARRGWAHIPPITM